MRGISEKQAVMLSLISPENRVPKDHPLRRIKGMADQELERLSRVFNDMYPTPAVPRSPGTSVEIPDLDRPLFGPKRARVL